MKRKKITYLYPLEATQPPILEARRGHELAASLTTKNSRGAAKKGARTHVICEKADFTKFYFTYVYVQLNYVRTLLKLQFYDSTFSLILIARKVLSQLHILIQI